MQGFQQGLSRQTLTLLYCFFNNSNKTINQSNNTNLCKFLSYIVENASYFIKCKSDVFFSKYKYNKFKIEVFIEFLNIVKRLIEYTHEYYKDSLNTTMNTPFLYVSHDGWDSKDYDILGVSIHFVLPCVCFTISLSVGL